MSTITDTAALDAAITEAELDDEHAEQVRELVSDGADLEDTIAAALADQHGSRHEPDEAELAAALEGPTPEQVEKMEKEHARHLKSLRTIMGPAFEAFTECEACQGQGIAPLGDPEPQPVHPDIYRECPGCNGYGRVVTGSRDPNNVTVQCRECAGRGYQERLDSAVPEPMPVVAQPPSGDEFGVPAWMGDPAVKPSTEWTPPAA